MIEAILVAASRLLLGVMILTLQHHCQDQQYSELRMVESASAFTGTYSTFYRQQTIVRQTCKYKRSLLPLTIINLLCTSSLTLFAANNHPLHTNRSKRTKRKKQTKQHDTKVKTADNKSFKKNPIHMLQAETRIEHIRSRILSIDLSPLFQTKFHLDPNTSLSNDIDKGNNKNFNSTRMDFCEVKFLSSIPNAICIVDNFLGPELIVKMRTEAESMVPNMIPSQSSKWDDATQSLLLYNKHNVLSKQIEGGDDQYQLTPCLLEYIVTLTSTLTRCINEKLSLPHQSSYFLSETQQTNKLAVCLGNGSSYDKHIDNMGTNDDVRKLTALLYLQLPASEEHDDGNSTNNLCDDYDSRKGGLFRAYDVPFPGNVQSIAPISDRLILFWSDTLVHDVLPSFILNGNVDFRWALTTWLVSDNMKGGTIQNTSSEVLERHFM